MVSTNVVHVPSRTAKKFDTDEIIDEFHTAGEGTDATGGEVSGQAIKFMSSDVSQQVRDITIQSGTQLKIKTAFDVRKNFSAAPAVRYLQFRKFML